MRDFLHMLHCLRGLHKIKIDIIYKAHNMTLINNQLRDTLQCITGINQRNIYILSTHHHNGLRFIESIDSNDDDDEMESEILIN